MRGETRFVDRGSAGIGLDDPGGLHPVAGQLADLGSGMAGAGQHCRAQAGGLGDGQRGDGAAQHVRLELRQGDTLRTTADRAEVADHQADASQEFHILPHLQGHSLQQRRRTWPRVVLNRSPRIAPGTCGSQ